MSHRVVSGLKWAKALDGRPRGIPIGRARGAKRHGVKYERDFAKAVGPSAWHGKWFEFVDSNGHGHCQPDFLMRVGDSIVILECKYSYVAEARSQLTRLYKPVVEAAFGAKAVGITVCKNLTSQMPNTKVTSDLGEAVRLALTRDSREIVLHWLAGPAFVARSTRHVEREDGYSLASL